MLERKLKKMLSYAALEYISSNMIVGVGTGTTISFFIDLLYTKASIIKGVVSSSKSTTKKLREYSIPIIDTNNVEKVDIYIDSANELNKNFFMIKGGGGALTQEKVIADMATEFLVIIDESKYVQVLGKYPIPVEVIPMARAHVSRCLIKLGGLPEYRTNFITDNGNIIIDVFNLNIVNPISLEKTINNIPGVVNVGLFANNIPDIVLLSKMNGIEKLIKANDV